MIELKDVSFAYTKETVLRNIDITFAKGRIYAVIGPNGSSKTTLLKVAAGLKTAEGALLLDGKSYGEFTRKEFARKVSYLPQVRPVPVISARELVSHGRFPYLDGSRRLSEEDKKTVYEAMEKCGCLHLKDRNVSALSGGERQKVYLAMLTAQDTQYIFLDEPATYLDISSQFAVMDSLKQMKNDGKCVVCVLHDISMALSYADEIIILSGGEITAKGTPHEVCASGELEKTMNIKCREILVDGKTEYIIKNK